MKLEIYFKNYSVNKADFCRKIGITYSALQYILKGTVPSLKTALAIEKETECKVTVRELYECSLEKKKNKPS